MGSAWEYFLHEAAPGFFSKLPKKWKIVRGLPPGVQRPHYSYDEDRMGNVIIYNPRGQEIAFLQGDDAAELLRNLEAIENLWLNRPMGRPLGPFRTFEDHLDHWLQNYD